MFLLLGVTYQHLGKYTCRVGLACLFRKKGNGQYFFALGRHVDNKCQFVGFQVAVKVIQLGSDFFISIHHDCRAYAEAGIDFIQAYDDRRVGLVCFPLVAHFYCQLNCLLSEYAQGKSAEQTKEDKNVFLHGFTCLFFDWQM